MKILSIIPILLFLLMHTAMGNNVRILGDVRVLDSDVNKETGIATVKIRVEWDNSWRDAFNHDAVYLFLKYKVDGDDRVWHHAYLMNEGHKVSAGYEYLLSNATGEKDKNQGVFISRTDKGAGNVAVDLELKWLITSNPDEILSREQFTSGSVFLSAMGVEMVYVPRGAFRAGDTRSANKFEYKDITLPAGRDVLSEATVDGCESSEKSLTNPASFAINRMNDISRDNSNAWVGRSTAWNQDWYDYWKVTLKSPKIIKNIAIESIEGGTPVKWQFQGLNGSGVWVTLYPKDGGVASGADWAVNSHRTYPCTRTLRLEWNTTNYQTYQVKILEANNPPVIKNISMSDKDIFNDVDNSVLIYNSQTTMSDRVGLYAQDSDTWAGKTGANYPNGYGAFYVMKYEISQEQYVAFLNKLTPAQQRTRTIGAGLERLLPGEYVFGPNRKSPSARNGIKLSSVSTSKLPYVFANDLNPNDTYAQDGDGQTIACNFLNAGDMMAYADWCGLRPMTELEFEKMSHRPFPEAVTRGEYAWNTTDFTPATDFVGGSGGKKNERLTSGNVNAEAKLKGPVRSGAFASGSLGQVAAGASFWGIMDLSGNLAEIYYNVNTEGRTFCGNQDVNHGNGKINVAGIADVSNGFWPVEPKAFALRGGSYRDNRDRTRISDRDKHWGVFNTVNEVAEMKDSTMTFRLGRTAPVLSVVSEVTYESGRTSATLSVDSVCSGSDYMITGQVPAEITGAHSIAWFQSSDKGVTWDLLEGEGLPSLNLHNLRNINSREDVFKEYWYMRYIYSNTVDVVQTNPVCLLVINHSLSLNTRRDTVDVYDHSNGIRVDVSQLATFNWQWLRDKSGSKPVTPEYTVKPNKIQLHYFKYTDFFDGSQYMGDQKILLEVRVMNKCPLTDTIRVFVHNYPTERNNVNNDAQNSVNTDFRCGDILIDNEENIPRYKKYRTVDIGGRCWFADNLNRALPAGGKGAVLCYDGDEKNCDVYGRLYNFYAATQTNTINITTDGMQGICPKGWHVPTNQEWIDMYATFGTDVDKDNSIVAGKMLKSSLGNWTYQNDIDKIGNNASRFIALPGGGRFFSFNGVGYKTEAGVLSRNGYGDIGVRAWWWTSSTTPASGNGCFWYSTSWASLYMPHHVSMDQDGNVYFNLNTRTDTYISLTNLLFNSTSTNYLDYNGNGTNAMTRIKNEFYMSVRCIRNK